MNYEFTDLVELGKKYGEKIDDQSDIAEAAIRIVLDRYEDVVGAIKSDFDEIFSEVERRAYEIYLSQEEIYGMDIIKSFVGHLLSSNEAKDLKTIAETLGKEFRSFDRFFLSLSQSRKARAGKTFEIIHNALFKKLGYPFTEQHVINGKPDFLMPSSDHYRNNPMDCIIFTAKRTVRERWRQIVTEGTRGLGFYLATIDKDLSGSQLSEMLDHRIYLVVPARIKNKQYSGVQNVLSFQQFFVDHLDPAMIRWKRNGIIW